MKKECMVVCTTNIRIFENGNKIGEFCNDIHSQNFAVAICRSLCNMPNGNVFKMAFGNGGHNSLGDKLPPKISNWNDTLYNEVYTEIVDVTSGKIGEGPGTVPEQDMQNVLFDTGPGGKVIEHEEGSSIVFTCHINKHEPTGQLDYVVDASLPADNYFAFDEIALFTDGIGLQATPGYQDVDVGDVNVDTKPGLNPNTQYSFKITVNSREYNIIFTTPNINTELTMLDIITKINNVFDINGIPVVAKVTNLSASTPINTYGFLRFESTVSGSVSNVFITPSSTPNPPPYLISSMAGVLQQPVNGTNIGVRMSSTNSNVEARRMLTHLILDNKIHKASNKSYLIEYEIKMRVENN